MHYVSILLAVIFLVLSVIHFYWALGGRWSWGTAIPTNDSGQRIMNPGFKASTIVGLGLLAFALLVLERSGWIHLNLPRWLTYYALNFVALIFFMRTIGDFKYIGFFKKVKETSFGRMDTRYYAPLCLIIGILVLIVQISYE